MKLHACPRRGKGALTSNDRNEVRLFAEYLRRVSVAQTPTEELSAFGDVYGATVYEAPDEGLVLELLPADDGADGAP